jgi:type I restriction enzyme S subunit
VRATNKLIPELRFPEFVNDREWKIKSINDLCNILNNLRKPISGSDRKKGDYPYYGASGIIDYVDEYIFDERLLLVGEDGAKWNAFENTAFLVEEKYWVNNHAHVLKPIKINDKLLESYLVKLDLQPYITGAAPPKLTLGKLKDIPIPVPENPLEQQKIASCLSSLDELIAAHNHKLDFLKDHKKGLMQNLFPQEGKKVPKYRFPDFLEDAAWVVTTVEKLIQEKVLFSPKDGNHGSIHPKSSEYVKKGIPFIMASDLKKGQIDFSNCAYLKKEQADSLQKGFAMSGDVLLTHKGTVGEVALLGKLEYPYIMLTPQVTYYRIKDKSKLVNEFLLAFFNSDFFQRNLIKVSGGGTRAYVGITKQKEFNVHYPKNPEEQKRIASCLSALEDVIIAQGEQIEQLKLHKKGLMQGLFPKVID